MKIKEGDNLRFKLLPGVLLAGTEGECQVEKFEAVKARCRNRSREYVVYIDIKTDTGSFSARYWPGEIAFAPIGSGEFLVYQ